MRLNKRSYNRKWVGEDGPVGKSPAFSRFQCTVLLNKQLTDLEKVNLYSLSLYRRFLFERRARGVINALICKASTLIELSPQCFPFR